MQPNRRNDWRARLAGGDAARLSLLQGYQSEKAFADAFFEQRNLLDELFDFPGEGTLEAYGIKFPEGYAVSGVERAALADFAAIAHRRRAPAKLVQEICDFFFRRQAALVQEMDRVDIRKQAEWRCLLEEDLGPSLEPMLAAGNALLDSFFGADPETKSAVLKARLVEGGRVGDHPAIIRLLGLLAMEAGSAASIPDPKNDGGRAWALN